MECNECKDRIIDEHRKMRHEYNNILQTIICYIEEGDIDQLYAYKPKLMEKVQLLNKNSLVQLVKIKDTFMLNEVYRLLESAGANGIFLNLTVYNDIMQISQKAIGINNELKQYLWQAYENAVNINSEISFKISLSEYGVNFRFETRADVSKEELSKKIINSSIKTKKIKDVFYNTYLQNEIVVQEIISSK